MYKGIIKEELMNFFPDLDEAKIDEFLSTIAPKISAFSSLYAGDRGGAAITESLLGIPNWTNLSREERD